MNFVTEGTAAKVEVWIYSKGNRDIVVELPEPMPAPATLELEGRAVMNVTPQARMLTLHLASHPDANPSRPGAADPTRYLWHAVLTSDNSSSVLDSREASRVSVLN